MPSETLYRPVVVDPWPSGGIEIAIEATADERKALAERFDLVAVERLVGRARLERDRRGQVIRLAGQFEADVVQPCVVSLEDVPAAVAETFECRFVRGAVDPDDLSWESDVEPLEGAELDVGEIFAQQLCVSLDPYPRAADAEGPVSDRLGPNVALGEDEPMGALAVAMMDGGSGVASATRPRQGRK